MCKTSLTFFPSVYLQIFFSIGYTHLKINREKTDKTFLLIVGNKRSDRINDNEIS